MRVPESFLAVLLVMTPSTAQEQKAVLTTSAIDVRDLVAAAEAGKEDEEAGERFTADLQRAIEIVTTEVDGRMVRIHQRGFLLTRLLREEQALVSSLVQDLRKGEPEHGELRFQVLVGKRIDRKVLGLEEDGPLVLDREELVDFLRKAQGAELRLHAHPPVREPALRSWKTKLPFKGKGDAEPEALAVDGLFVLAGEGELALSLRPDPEDDEARGQKPWELRARLAEGQTAVYTVQYGEREIVLLVTRP